MDYRKYLLENSATLQDCPLYWQVFRVYVAKALFLGGGRGVPVPVGWDGPINELESYLYTTGNI